MPLTHWLPDAPCSQQLGALCAAWAALYLGTRHTVLRHRSAAFANRVVSLLHAAVSIPLCVLALRGRRPLSEFGQATRPEEVRRPRPEAGRAGRARAARRRPGRRAPRADGRRAAAQHAALSVSLAYFLYDTLWCALAERDGAATLAHHLLTVAGLAVGWRGRSGTELTLCLLLMEARRRRPRRPSSFRVGLARPTAWLTAARGARRRPTPSCTCAACSG